MKNLFCTHVNKQGHSTRVVVDRWRVGWQNWREERCTFCGRIWRDRTWLMPPH